MTPEAQHIPMTPEAQQIAIARILYPRFSDIEIYAHLSDNDYLNDLNAMHEAEKVLTSEQHDDYYLHLGRIVGDKLYHATAAQRAEAFLRTLGLWINSGGLVKS